MRLAPRLVLVGAILIVGMGCLGKDFSVSESRGDLGALDADVGSLRIRGIHDSDVEELARFKAVRNLDFTGGWKALPLRLTSVGFGRIADLELPVESINLGQCQNLDDEGLRHVGRMRGLTLVTLNESMGLTPTGLGHITALPHLAYLDLRRCSQIDDSWIETLTKCRTLTQLGVTATRISPAGVARLRAALPDCHVDDELPFIDAALDRAQYPGWAGPPERKGR